MRIGTLTASLLVGTALIFDALQGLVTLVASVPIPPLQPIIVLAWYLSGLAFTIFLLWFKFLGVNYLDRNANVKLLTIILAFAFESVPIVSMIPALTLGVVAMIVISRYEDGEMGLMNRAAKKRKNMTQKERYSAEINAQAQFDKDQRSFAARRVREKGGEKAMVYGDFGSAQEALQKKQDTRQRKFNPEYEAPLFDPEEEALARAARERERKQQ
jgi:ribosomal protein L25 (general stress protein Ctc)